MHRRGSIEWSAMVALARAHRISWRPWSFYFRRLVRGSTLLAICLMTGTNRRHRVLSLLARKSQILNGRLVPVVPIAASVPYLMLVLCRWLSLVTIWLNAVPLFPLWWHVLRTLWGLLTEILIRKLPLVRKCV